MPRVKRNIQEGYNTAFAKRLRTLIEEKDISQNQLAGIVGKTRQAVNSYTLGNTAPDSDTLIKLSEYFNVSVDYLLGLSDVRTVDKDIKFVCDYTGLSENAVTNLHYLRNTQVLDFEEYKHIVKRVRLHIEDEELKKNFEDYTQYEKSEKERNEIVLFLLNKFITNAKIEFQQLIEDFADYLDGRNKIINEENTKMNEIDSDEWFKYAEDFMLKDFTERNKFLTYKSYLFNTINNEFKQEKEKNEYQLFKVYNHIKNAAELILDEYIEFRGEQNGND